MSLNSRSVGLWKCGTTAPVQSLELGPENIYDQDKHSFMELGPDLLRANTPMQDKELCL